MSYRVAIIGTGPDPGTKSRNGYAMAYRHAPGYLRLAECDLVACADIVPEHAEAFAGHFELDQVYTDHETMLRECDLDIVSICVPPAVHAEIVRDCAALGGLAAIHCEKPMATTWGDCTRMVDVCDQHGVQLTIDHQRRFATPVQKAKALLDDGAIGALRRLEWSEVNLFDAGSHLFDLCDYFTEGASATWALAGIDPASDNRWFGALNEVQAIAQWGYDDGTMGFASTGENGRPTTVDAYLRVVGDEGVIEIQPIHGPPLRMRTDGGWQQIDTGNETVFAPRMSTSEAALNKIARALPWGVGDSVGSPTHYERAIEHAVVSLRNGTTPIIAGDTVLRGTELIFACWEAARQRERVDLPLKIEGNPLKSILREKQSETPSETGDIPEPRWVEPDP